MTYILNIIFRVCIMQVLLHFFATNCVKFFLIIQAWRGRKRQARGHHSPSSIQGEWLTIDDIKNNILASLSLASYLAANWLQKLETKHCV